MLRLQKLPRGSGKEENMYLSDLKLIKAEGCVCGRKHPLAVDEIIMGSGVLLKLPEIVKKYGAKKAFVLSDKNTYKAAGEKVVSLLKENGIVFTSFSFEEDHLEPDEYSVGRAVMQYEHDCDIVIGVGSGVINDIGKIISAMTGHTYIIVGTAPSMDGYASASSSMTRGGLKISLPSKCADVIIGDTDILKEAPMPMLKAGLGDMIAKYVSIAEWRIANLITGEYYCEDIAALVRASLKRCTDNAAGLLKRDEKAVEAVFEGLVTSGLAMNFAGVSRPASGVEHYLSHIWDMRGVAFGTPVESHGMQCAVGTLISAKLYEKVKTIVPDRQKALDYVKNFDGNAWNDSLKEFLGKGAQIMIDLEKKEQKYSKELHAERLEIILENWDKILRIIEEEIPSAMQLEALMDSFECMKSPEEFGISGELIPMTFKASKDIRDKYVLSRLAWDLGIMDELFEK